LISGFKKNKFRKILVLTGSGISINAGVPDFKFSEDGEDFKLFKKLSTLENL